MPQKLQPLAAAAAGYPHRLHRLLNGQDHGRHRHYDAAHDHVLDAPRVVVEGWLLCEAGEQKVPVSKILGLRKARAENSRHNGRFGQKMMQGFLQEGRAVYARRGRDHQRFHRATFQSFRLIGFASSVTKYGSQQVNSCVANPEISVPTARLRALVEAASKEGQAA